MSQFKQRTNNNGSKAEGTKASTLHIADLAPDLNPGTAEADDAEHETHSQRPPIAATRSFRMAKDDKTARLVIGFVGVVAVAFLMLVLFSQKSKPKLKKSGEANLGRPKVAETAPASNDSIVPGGSMQPMQEDKRQPGHQKTYLSDIVRILYYTGKRYNIYDILVMAYDLDVLKEQAAIARARIERLPDVSHQQRLNFQMVARNLVESFSDPKRVQMIRGLINQMMTFLEDKLSIITGPYEDLISIEDVIEDGRILFVSLNTNKNDDTTRALGRMILQNLQLVIGERYERKRADMYMPFVSVIMDEFAPIAYSNFANILQTARGSEYRLPVCHAEHSPAAECGKGLPARRSLGAEHNVHVAHSRRRHCSIFS